MSMRDNSCLELMGSEDEAKWLASMTYIDQMRTSDLSAQRRVSVPHFAEREDNPNTKTMVYEELEQKLMLLDSCDTKSSQSENSIAG